MTPAAPRPPPHVPAGPRHPPPWQQGARVQPQAAGRWVGGEDGTGNQINSSQS